MSERNRRIDIARGIGIFLVVLGHTQIRLGRFINLFHVGLFFIISGFCFKERYSENLSNVKEFCIKRVKGLYFPFVLWNIVFLCFRNWFCTIGIYSTDEAVVSAYALVGRITFQEAMRQVFHILTLQAGEQLASPCWFVRALFLFEISFIVIDYIGKKLSSVYYRHWRWIIAVIMAGIGAYLNAEEIVLPDNLSTICSIWILFVSGVELKNFRFPFWEKLHIQKTIKNLGVAACGLLLLAFLNTVGSISYDSNSYPDILFFLIAAGTGWIVVYNVSEIIYDNISWMRDALSYIGKRTMSILFLHLLCFKLVSLLYVRVYNLDYRMIASFPVITNSWWFLYLVAGISGALILTWIYGKVNNICREWRVKDGKYILVCIEIVLLFIIFYTGLHSDKVDNTMELDYSLVYDKEEYMRFNPDVVEVLGSDEDLLFEHFIKYGMAEGRIASEAFDVYYYKSHNADVAEAYGENMKEYYIHYICHGYEEGRSGTEQSTVNEGYECILLCEIRDEDGLKLTLNVENHELIGSRYYIFEMPAYGMTVDDAVLVAEGVLQQSSFINVKFHELNNKYVAAVKTENDYKMVSNTAYISNPELLDQNILEMPVAHSKKGLQMTDKMIDDVFLLDPSYTFRNLIIELIMCPNEYAAEVITFEYAGRTYYFNKDIIEQYDAVLSEQTQKGIITTASVISIKTAGFEALNYKEIDSERNAAFYAINTSEEEGLKYLEAFVSFMSNRYDGTSKDRGLITNWVVGNEVNESGTYNYMGERELSEYLEEYTRTFRVVYNIVKSNIAGAGVYVPMEPWWGISSNKLTYGGKEFLDSFNAKMALEGNIDWGLAYHAYSYPLNDPKVLNDVERTLDENGDLTLDGYVTTDSVNSVTISMENIEVLTNYMHNKELLDKNGEVRSIILSEQGYTSNSNIYGECEALQAASMVYAYYKAEMNTDIDAFIYFLQIDSQASSLGNNYYQFGLWKNNENEDFSKKLSHDVFKVMDRKESLTKLDWIKNVLDLEEWGMVIPDFHSSVFENFRSVEEYELPFPLDFESGKDMVQAQISDIKVQKYTGLECLPELEIWYNGNLLVNDQDYDTVYIRNVDPGEAKVVIIGLNEYQGMIETTFRIE